MHIYRLESRPPETTELPPHPFRFVKIIFLSEKITDSESRNLQDYI